MEVKEKTEESGCGDPPPYSSLNIDDQPTSSSSAYPPPTAAASAAVPVPSIMYQNPQSQQVVVVRVNESESYVGHILLSCCTIWCCVCGAVCGLIAFILAGRLLLHF